MSRAGRIEDSATWAWVGVTLLSGCAALAALITVFLVPLYAGSVIVPVAVALALAGNIVLPRLAHGLIERTAATALPFLSWLLVTVIVGLTPRPEGDVVLPGGGVQWVSYGVLLGGALAGTTTVVLSAPRRASPAQLSR
jgi:hypothetical protein